MSSATPLRVLVVEDDPAFQKVLTKRLEAEGFDVAVAPDGREGMKLIVAFAPHIVLSDWMMPHVDGLELCQAIKTGLGEEAPYFVLITAKGEVSDRVLALDKGADDYLVKPCDHGEILARVRSGMRTVELKRELTLTQGRMSRLEAELVEREAELSRLRNGQGGGPARAA